MNPKGINFLCSEEEEGLKFAERAGGGAPRCSSISPSQPRPLPAPRSSWALPAWSADRTLRNNPLPLPGPLPPSTIKTCKHHHHRPILCRKARLCSGQEETPQQPCLSRRALAMHHREHLLLPLLILEASQHPKPRGEGERAASMGQARKRRSGCHPS